MARRPKKYRLSRKHDRRAALDAEMCAAAPAREDWERRRQKFIDSLPRLSPAEVLALLERPPLVTRAALFCRLRREVLPAPDGGRIWAAFGAAWLAHYGSGRLPATWWDGWPPELTVYKGV
jgi:hypothetical protein